jgi:hypothetical protein
MVLVMRDQDKRTIDLAETIAIIRKHVSPDLRCNGFGPLSIGIRSPHNPNLRA